MNTRKTILFLVLSMFLLSTVSAMVTDADFTGNLQSATIRNGESIGFEANFFTMHPQMNMKVELRNSSNDLLNTFLSAYTTEGTRSFSGTITRSMYLTTGSFVLIATATDNAAQTDTVRLNLTVLAENIAPVITLTGANPQIITRGTAYTELGATATDNISGNLTSSITINECNCCKYCC